MSVRYGLLSILAKQNTHGYQLKSSFEARTAGAWPLNVGQVYTTLNRLERDGLVESITTEDPTRQSWTITEAGQSALTQWYRSPIEDRPARDELIIKVLLALANSHSDAQQVIRQQRLATMKRLQEYTQHKREYDPDKDLSWILLIDAFILRADAEARWLDLCEERLSQLGGAAS